VSCVSSKCAMNLGILISGRQAVEGDGLQSLRENLHLVPKGRLKVAQDGSPG
jgi:hypothetical protein